MFVFVGNPNAIDRLVGFGGDPIDAVFLAVLDRDTRDEHLLVVFGGDPRDIDLLVLFGGDCSCEDLQVVFGGDPIDEDLLELVVYGGDPIDENLLVVYGRDPRNADSFVVFGEDWSVNDLLVIVQDGIITPEEEILCAEYLMVETSNPVDELLLVGEPGDCFLEHACDSIVEHGGGIAAEAECTSEGDCIVGLLISGE